jgi:hypothetical protein
MNTQKRVALLELRAQELAAASTLFEAGPLVDGISLESFVRRLSTILTGRLASDPDKVPASLSGAISQKGVLNEHAEVGAFGRWLLIDDHPGLKKNGGKQPDPRTILKCVAVAIRERRVRAQLIEHHLASPGREGRTREITKHDLSEGWRKTFGEAKEPSFFDAKLRSMKRILPAYQLHLNSGRFKVEGKQIKRSPEIDKVLRAITSKPKVASKHHHSTAVSTAEAVHAALIPFDIWLRYSSIDQANEYRKLRGSALPHSCLHYKPILQSSSPNRGVPSTEPKGKIQLVPQFVIRGKFKTEAVIDRIVILVNTTAPVRYDALYKQIRSAAAASVYVQDLTLKAGAIEWGVPLPEPDLRKKTGYHFAIMIQTPVPTTLSEIMRVIQDGVGVDGPVSLHLIEVSIDFYPQQFESPEQSLFLREQMVGLLQRHHWNQHSKFRDPLQASPRNIDARQVYRNVDERIRKAKIRYLFSHGGPLSQNADCEIELPGVRQRVLTQKTGEELYLNSTLVKGALNSHYLVRIQHKIADSRNRMKSSMDVLPDDKRRARIEVTISGSDKLEEQGLRTIDELATVSFRRLAKSCLSFRLAEIEPLQHLLDDAIEQMQTRGVYGIELRHRARALQVREERRRARKKLPPLNDREGQGLRSWQEMNDVVGKALDELQRRWSRFSWK